PSPSSPLVSNGGGVMGVYEERLGVPFGWWLLGLVTIILLATEVAAGYAWPVMTAVYAVLVGGLAVMLLNWGRPAVEVGGGELRAGPGRLQLGAVGEGSALGGAQTRALRGPRADPAALLGSRPYPRRAGVGAGGAPRRGGAGGGGEGRLRRRGFRPRVELVNPVVDSPYWLVSTRHPAELAAAIERARPAARAGGATMG